MGLDLNNMKYYENIISCYDKENDVCALYHPHLGNKAFFKEPIVNGLLVDGHLNDDLTSLNEEIYNELVVKKFIVLKNMENNYYINQFRKTIKSMPVITTLYLIPTLNCNFRCKYCYMMHNIKGSTNITESVMSEELAFKAIDWFDKNGKNMDKKFEVIFYGGEPLLHPKLVIKSIEYIRKKNKIKNAKIVINTNGSLLSEWMMKKFMEYDVYLAISLDGVKEINDMARVYKNGNETFNDVFNNIIKCIKIGVNLGISCTIGSHNFENIEENAIWLVKNIGTSNIGFNFMISFNKSESNKYFLNYDEVFYQKIFGLYKKLQTMGIIEKAKLPKRWKFFRDRHYCHASCGACIGQVVVSPDGYIGPCHAFIISKKYYTKFTEEILSQENNVWDLWSNRTPVNMEDCKNCKYISICGGGCAYNAETINGNIYNKDPVICGYMPHLIEYYLWETYKGLQK